MTDSEFDAAIQKLNATTQELRDRYADDSVDRAVDSIADGLKLIGAMFAVEIAKKRSGLFADWLDLEYRRDLTMKEVVGLVKSQDTADIPRQDLRDFRRTSVVVEAEDAGGQLHYIAVIATVAAEETDARCAIRNAGYLARFTGKLAHAVVASVRMADGFQEVIASGGFHWVCLDKRDYD